MWGKALTNVRNFRRILPSVFFLLAAAVVPLRQSYACSDRASGTARKKRERRNFRALSRVVFSTEKLLANCAEAPGNGSRPGKDNVEFVSLSELAIICLFHTSLS